MLKQCQDSYHSTFGTYEDMLDYHEEQVKASQWQRCQVNTLQVEPLDKASPLYGSLSDFAAGVTQEAVDDTAENLGLACPRNTPLPAVPTPFDYCTLRTLSSLVNPRWPHARPRPIAYPAQPQGPSYLTLPSMTKPDDSGILFSSTKEWRKHDGQDDISIRK